MEITRKYLWEKIEKAQYVYITYNKDKKVVIKSRTFEVDNDLREVNIDNFNSLTLLYTKDFDGINSIDEAISKSCKMEIEDIIPLSKIDLKVMEAFVDSIKASRDTYVARNRVVKLQLSSTYGLFNKKPTQNTDDLIIRKVEHTETGELLSYLPYFNALGDISLFHDKETLPHIEEGFYRHFKNKLYYVKGVAMLTHYMDTDGAVAEPHVIYTATYGDGKTYARPYSMFMSDVDKEKYPNIKQKERFKFIGYEKPENKRAYFIINEIDEATALKINKLQKYLRRLRYIDGYIVHNDIKNSRLIVKIDYDPKTYRKSGIVSILNGISTILNRDNVIYFEAK